MHFSFRLIKWPICDAICNALEFLFPFKKFIKLLDSLLFTTLYFLTLVMELINTSSPPPPSIYPPDPSTNPVLMTVTPLQTAVSRFLYHSALFFSLKELLSQLITFTRPSSHTFLSWDTSSNCTVSLRDGPDFPKQSAWLDGTAPLGVRDLMWLDGVPEG